MTLVLVTPGVVADAVEEPNMLCAAKRRKPPAPKGWRLPLFVRYVRY